MTEDDFGFDQGAVFMEQGAGIVVGARGATFIPPGVAKMKPGPVRSALVEVAARTADLEEARDLVMRAVLAARAEGASFERIAWCVGMSERQIKRLHDAFDPLDDPDNE